MGAIASIVKQYVPASYSALVGSTNAYYGPEDLQSLADFVKFRLYNTVVAEASEAGYYNTKEQRLLGVLTTLQFIPAAVEYWSQSYSSISTSPTSENVSYFDHRPDLWRIFDRLTAEAELLSLELGINLNAARGVVPKVSYGDNGRGVLITSDPECFPPAFRKTPNTHEEFIHWDVVA